MNALTVVKPLTPSTWQMIESIAPAMHACRLFGVSSKEQAMAIMLKGYELGLPLTASFEFITVIQGKPALIPRGCLALIMQSPELDKLEVEDLPNSCRVTMKRKNGFAYAVEFTLDDAKKAGLIKPDSGWDKYPANMLRWRAIGFCADVVFPDVIGGMKRADELGANISPKGDVIEGQWNTYTEPKVTLDSLGALYGYERVLEVCNNVLPSTDEEIKMLAEKLEKGE